MKRPRLLFPPLLALTLLLPTARLAEPQKPAAGKTAARQGKQAGAKQPAGKPGASRKKAGAKTRARGPQQPEPGRIREIQQALAERGYAVQPTGVWDGATVEALKKFQEDRGINNFSGRGKLDPRTLIALGLGPATADPALSGAVPPQNSTEGKQP